jgi:hypothetical protein
MGADMIDYTSSLVSNPMDDAALAELFGETEPLEFGNNIVVASQRPSQEESSHAYSLRSRSGSKSPEQGK